MHYLSVPEYDPTKINQAKVDRVEMMQTVVELGRQIRERNLLSIKQPVREVLVVRNDATVLANVDALQSYIAAVRAWCACLCVAVAVAMAVWLWLWLWLCCCWHCCACVPHACTPVQELNTMAVTTSADEASWVKLSAAANAKSLAPRLGKGFRAVQQAIAALPAEDVAKFAEAGETATMEVAGTTVTAADVTVDRTFCGDASTYAAAVSKDGSVTVVMNIVQDAELHAMHMAREAVNRVQKLRKAAGLKFSDVVDVYFTVAEAQPPVLENCPAPVLIPADVSVPAAALKPKPKPAAGAGAGAGASGADESKQQTQHGGKGKKGGKQQQGKKGGKQQGKGKKGGKQQGKGKKGSSGGAGANAGAGAAAPTGAAAVATLVAALNTQGATLHASVAGGFVPDCLRPAHAVVLARETTNVGGASMTVILTRPAARFAPDAAFPSEVRAGVLVPVLACVVVGVDGDGTMSSGSRACLARGCSARARNPWRSKCCLTCPPPTSCPSPLSNSAWLVPQSRCSAACTTSPTQVSSSRLHVRCGLPLGWNSWVRISLPLATSCWRPAGSGCDPSVCAPHGRCGGWLNTTARLARQTRELSARPTPGHPLHAQHTSQAGAL